MARGGPAADLSYIPCMYVDAGHCVLREWRESDVAALPAIANDAEVARFMSDRFPHPYTLEDAGRWLAITRAPGRDVLCAIEVDGELAGGIGYEPRALEQRHAAHIGYWLGKRFWGRGIASAACRALTEYAFAHDIVRLDTTVYAPNAASMRVLEKCGYAREGVMRDAVCKNGVYFDAILYSALRTPRA